MGVAGRLGARAWRYRGRLALAALLLGLAGLGGAVAGWNAWAQYRYRAARQALARRDFAQARQDLLACLGVWPRDLGVHLLLAQACRRAGLYAEAEQHLSFCQQLEGLTDDVMLERSLLTAQRGQPARVAGFLLSRADKAEPVQAMLILEALTQGYLKSYRLTQAEHCLRLWLRRDPDDVQALLWHAQAKEYRGARQAALDDYRRVLELDPGRADVRLHLADALLELQQVPEAARQFGRLHADQPVDRAAALGLARCRIEQGANAEAWPLLDALRAQVPDDPAVLSACGRLALNERRLDEAERWLRRAHERAPHGKETLYALYLCLQQRGAADEAKRYFAEWDRVTKDLRRLAEVTRQVHDTPDDPGLRHEAGMIFLRTGQDREGLRWLQSALEEDPHYAPTHEALAAYFRKAGDEERARYHERAAREGSEH